jgi:hypothetical protein
MYIRRLCGVDGHHLAVPHHYCLDNTKEFQRKEAHAKSLGLFMSKEPKHNK